MSLLPFTSPMGYFSRMGAMPGPAPIVGPSAPPIPGMNPTGRVTGFQGLLENPLFGAGLGLLSANTPSLTPPNYAQGIMGGLAMSQQAKMGRENQEMQAMRYRTEMQRLAQQQEEWQAKQTEAARLSTAQDELKRIVSDPSATPEQKTAAMIEAGYGSPVVENMLKPPAEAWSEPYVDNSTGKPILVQRSSTTGQLRSVGTGGVDIHMGDAQKPVGTDATKYIFPDGSAPLPTETIESIVAKGGRLVTPGEEAQQKREGGIEADKAELDAKMAGAQQDYDAALEAFNQNPTNPKAIRDLSNAAAALRTAMGGKENWRGEPSGDVVKRFNVPGPLGVTVEKGIEAIFGNGSTQIARPTTQAEYDALPGGATYVDPDDGKTYRKP